MRRTPSLSIGYETLLTLGSKGVMAGLGFAGIIIFANVLGDVGLGEYRTVLAVAFVVTQLPAGTGSAIQKRVSEVDVSPGAFLSVGLLTHAVASVVVAAGYLVLRPFAVDYLGTPELAFGVVLVVLSLGLFNITNSFFAGIGYPARASWVDTVRSVLTLGFQLLFLWQGFEALGLVFGYVLATAVSAGISVVSARVWPRRPTMDVVRRVYDFARWSVPNSLLTNLSGNMNVILIRALVGAGPVGIYTVAAQLVMPAALFGSSIRGALMVKSSGVDSIGGNVRPDLANAASYAGLVAIPILFGSLAIPEALMRTLFGSDFADAPGLALVGMALYQIGNVYRQPFEAVIEGSDRPSLVFRTNTAVVLSQIPLAVAFGWLYGLLGVIAATATVSLLRVAIYQYVSAREFGGVVLTRPMLDQVVAGGVMFLVVEAMTRSLVTISSWVWLALVVGVGAGTYFLTLALVSSHFRDTIMYVVPFLPDPVVD